MGINITKLGADGDKFQARLRPLLVQGMMEMRRWKLPSRPIKYTLSKKALLLPGPSSPRKGVAMDAVVGNIYGLKVVIKPKRARIISGQNDSKAKKLDADEDVDDDIDVYDDQGRKIGALPASPSFRIFFQDAAATQNHNQIGGIDETSITETVTTGDSAPSEKKEGKRRSIGRVMSGKKAGVAVKNLLNMNACYCSSTLPAAADRRRVAP